VVDENNQIHLTRRNTNATDSSKADRGGIHKRAQKKEIISKLTDAMVAIEGEALRPYTLVTIEDVRSGDWGVGGKTLTTGDVRALAAVQK
jgi:4-oxalocrotonate tautomerase